MESRSNLEPEHGKAHCSRESRVKREVTKYGDIQQPPGSNHICLATHSPLPSHQRLATSNPLHLNALASNTTHSAPHLHQRPRHHLPRQPAPPSWASHSLRSTCRLTAPTSQLPRTPAQSGSSSLFNANASCRSRTAHDPRIAAIRCRHGWIWRSSAQVISTVAFGPSTGLKDRTQLGSGRRIRIAQGQ